ncbi:MAG: fliT [Ramlibacter sp.]|nr:fliT [Ramlibacter sp.]MDB5913784.1 fliT [Ramlibacter sp.]
MNLLGCYGQLAFIVTRMLEVARAGEWDQLPALDAQCTAAARQLQVLGSPELSAWEWALVRSLGSRIRVERDALNALLRPQFTALVRRVQTLEEAR